MDKASLPVCQDRIASIASPPPLTKKAAPVCNAGGRPFTTSTRTFLQNRFVYTVISQRAKGLSIGVNMNPDRLCNFDCIYCEVMRNEPPRDDSVDVKVLVAELQRTLTMVKEGRMREHPGYQCLPDEILQLKEVALSGNGEPTLCPNFVEVVQAVVHIRAKGAFPFFKIVLITNATGLDRPEVRAGLHLLTPTDEIWAKLDAGSQHYMNTVNRPRLPNLTLSKVMANLLALARERPVVIQSLWPLINDQEPATEETEQFVQRLAELKAGGAQISLVQVYSAHRPTIQPDVGHLPLKGLSRIAQRVREVTGLKAEVF
jgi:wyosine [tRNA(Phe)-imidazoG37] synthetase (radical SAM superfamily)